MLSILFGDILVVEMTSKSPKPSRQQLEGSVSILKDEIRRLHTELNQVKTDLKLERARAMNATFALQEKERELVQYQFDYDQEMKDIISKLTLLEADFGKEKKEITRLMTAKDATIESLSNEVSTKNKQIESFRRKVRSLQSLAEKDEKFLKFEKKMESQKQEIDNLRNANARLLESLSHVRLSYPNTHHKSKFRRGSSPVPSKGQKSSDGSEWKEELSAFF